MKHTDGPWNVAEIQTEDWRLSICADDCEIGCAYHRNDDPVNADEETYANARLIAAAPDLMQALKRYFSEMEIGDIEQRDMESFERMAKAAIDKVESYGNIHRSVDTGLFCGVIPAPMDDPKYLKAAREWENSIDDAILTRDQPHDREEAGTDGTYSVT